MDRVLSILANSWPVLAALAIVGVITFGATMPYIRRDRKRREEMEQDND
ncbi:hypothetical protein [Marivita sp. GX14005]|nr:hypothetical protein [Marivita sp. GX14005]MCL3882847.1 hypothetical protein [Marivita sp. GX14005]